MDEIAPKLMSTRFFTELDREPRLVAVSLNRFRFGVYVPCQFDLDGVPNWDQVLALISTEREKLEDQTED